MRKPLQNNKQFKKTQRKLDSLYPEYKRLKSQDSLTKEENKRLDLLISIISNLEAKWLKHLKAKTK